MGEENSHRLTVTARVRIDLVQGYGLGRRVVVAMHVVRDVTSEYQVRREH